MANQRSHGSGCPPRSAQPLPKFNNPNHPPLYEEALNNFQKTNNGPSPPVRTIEYPLPQRYTTAPTTQPVTTIGPSAPPIGNVATATLPPARESPKNKNPTALVIAISVATLTVLAVIALILIGVIFVKLESTVRN